MAKREPTPLRLDGTFDLEVSQWDRMVVGVLYSPRDGTTIVKTPEELTDALLRRGGTWWAWNGGRFDALAVADVLLQRGLLTTCSMSGSSVTRMVCGGLTILDAMALVPLSLETAAQIAGEVAVRGLGWDCGCGEDCGGYCEIRPGMPRARWHELARYCAHDAMVAYRVLATLFALGPELGLTMRGTLGSTAWRSAQAGLGLPDAEWRPDLWKRVRQADFGGRVTVVRPTAKSGDHWDMSSAYPAALAQTPVPVGDPVEAAGRRARLAYRRGIAGVYLARVDVPDMLLPPLPVRPPDGRSICYPIGRVEGWWTAPELQAAERRGCKLVAIAEAVAWPDGVEPIYAPLIERWWAARKLAGKGSALGAWLRLLANSLTGVLGQRPDREGVYLHPKAVRYCDPASPKSAKAGCTRRRCTGECGAYRQLDRDGKVWGVGFWRLGPSSHVHHAAYLRSVTRIAWLDAADAVADDLVYGDTDSLWVDGFRTPPNVGSGLGQWEHKHAWTDFSCRAPKVYRYTATDTGEVVTRVAGMARLTDDQWTGKDLRIESNRGIKTLREAAPGGSLFARRWRQGRLPVFTGWYGDRRLNLSDGRTYPVAYGEKEASDRTDP